MTPLCGYFQVGLLQGASLIVPAKLRAEWRQEWEAELWHVRRACGPVDANAWQAQREIILFCMGAFKDALCLRRYSWRRGPIVALRGSAPLCIFWLVAILAVCFALAHLLPGVRTERDPSRYKVNPGLILIQDASYLNDATATIPFEQFQIWRQSRQRYFDALAFYWISREAISTQAHGKDEWEVAHASSNLFALLGLPIEFARTAEDVDSKLPKVILSDRAWKEEFGGNSHAAGNVVRIGRLQAAVIGVMPEGEWRLPGNADVWLMEQDSRTATAANVGYVVAHLNRLGRAAMRAPRVQITSYSSDSSQDEFSGWSFEQRTQGPWGGYVFTVILALLALPAITSVSLGEYNFASRKPNWRGRLCRWGFLCAKFAMVLAIAYYASLDLAYGRATPYSPAGEYIQLIASFSICLLGLRWMLLDQRQRCPVCLRCVTSPAQVGVASRTFLAWNGTELMCAGGHTLLHVPGLPTSWFSTQRWMYLDASWAFLFATCGGADAR